MKTSSKKFVYLTVFVIITSQLTLSSCLNTKSDTTMKISENFFGRIEEKEIKIFELENPKGSKVSITNFGAIVQSLYVRDREGNFEDIVLGFDSLEDYIQQTSYFGAIAGRYANRIAFAQFTLDGKTYQLSANDGNHHLHGGFKGFDKVIWDARPYLDTTGACLELHYISKDGEEGYPGTLDVYVTYCFTLDDELKIYYQATTDHPTILNLTHHSYFNLSGFTQRNILEHELIIHADSFTPVDSTLIPTGEIVPVKNTVFDFTSPRPIGSRIREVFNKKTGYDNNYVLNTTDSTVHPAAKAYDPESGRILEVFTDQPGLQFYSGNFLDGKIKGKNGKIYQQHDGFCLETQHFPDSPNHPEFPSTVLRPGQIFRSLTIYKFSTDR